MPCNNCRRAQISCIYPAPGRAPRRPRPRDPNAPPKAANEREQLLLQRLHKLEGIVEDLSGQIELDHAGSGSKTTNTGPSPEVPAGASTASVSSTEAAARAREHERETSERKKSETTPMVSVQKQLGRLVLHDKERAARYVSSAFWSELKDELDELRDDMDSFSADTDDSGDETTPDQSPESAADNTQQSHHGFLFGYSSAQVDVSKLHPLPSQVPFLWQVFQENIDPLVKVLHTPTMESLLRELRRDPQALRAADQALIFTVYYSAIASLEEDEVQTNFGAPQAHFLAQYRFALEQALAQANLLNTTDIAVVQCLALFLTIARRHDDSKFCWTMTSLVVRIAQALGLHRDGVQLGLPPFEVEMRRRLWWCIMALDLRSAEELGSDLSVGDKSFDTQLPSNINDTDIDENTAEMPVSRNGRTDSACCLVRYEICALARKLHTITTDMGEVSRENVVTSLEERERMLTEVYERVERKFLSHAMTDNDPLFWVASMVARIIMSKIGLLIYQPVLFPGTGPELSKEIRDRLFISTIEIVEYNHILNTDPRCKQWRWLFQTYRQWHAIAYMLLEVSRRPWNVTSERAWDAAQILGYDSHTLEYAKHANHTAVWMPMKKLYLRAKRHREAEALRLRADPAAVEQLDREERTDPFSQRLDPVAGMEMRMPQLRARWRRLVEGGTPGTPRVGLDLSAAPTTAAPTTAAPTTASPAQDPVSGQPDLLASMMSPGFNAADVWQYVYDGGGGAALEHPTGLYPPSVGQSMGSSMGASPAVSWRVGGPVAEEAVRQQGMAMQTTPEGDFGGNAGAWLWSDPFGAVNAGAPFGDVQPGDEGDVNMDFGDDFDWEDFQKQLKGVM